MWCADCQIEVPAVAAPSDPQVLRCPRCHGSLEQLADATDAASELGDEDTPGLLDDESWDAELAELERWISELEKKAARAPAADEPVLASSARGPMLIAFEPPSPVTLRVRSGWLSSFALAISLMLTTCGSALIAWDSLADRAAFGQIGWPLIIAGQAGLILASVLQLELIAHTQREAERAITELDQQAHRWRQLALHSEHANLSSPIRRAA